MTQVKSVKSALLLALLPFALGGLALLVDHAFGQRNTASAADGTPAPALVERAGDGSCMLGYRASHCYALQLQVHPPTGSPFESTIDVIVADRWASRIQPGQWVSVILLRDKPGAVALDLEAFALPPPQPPTPPTH